MSDPGLEIVTLAADAGLAVSVDGRWSAVDAAPALQAPELSAAELLAPASCRLRDSAGAEYTGARTLVPRLEPGATLRLAHALLPDGRLLVVAAVRPAGAQGHDQDRIGALSHGPDGEEPLADPRLSSTYDAEGALLRVGLELWPEAGGDEAVMPRRAAGEVAGPVVEISGGGLRGRAWEVRWRSRGQAGEGLYLLAQGS